MDAGVWRGEATTCLKNGSRSAWRVGRGGGVGPVRKVEAVSAGQQEQREETPQHMRDAPEATAALRTCCACVSVCMWTPTCVYVCESARGQLRGAGAAPVSASQDPCTRMPRQHPLQTQTPRHWSVRTPPGQEQLLLNQGQRGSRGAGLGLVGSALRADVGAGAAGGSP